MDRQFLIFGGTSEGRELAEYLCGQQIPATVCVATEYGEEVLPSMEGIHVLTGRMDRERIALLLKETQPLGVVDATHPYAQVVTENVREACREAKIPVLRLVRQETDLEEIPGIHTFADCETAARWLEGQEGNILLTTGMKELPEFANYLTDKKRIYARVLLQEAVFEQMEQFSLTKKQIICMQGPFSKEMNIATMHMVKAAFLVTKESGKNGGFEEKVEAAREAGAECVVIQRPVKESGYDFPEICERLKSIWENEDWPEQADDGEVINAAPRKITLLGIGMGYVKNMTMEALEACEKSDCIIGASRMLHTLEQFSQPKIPLYISGEIVAFLHAHPEYRQIVIALSGDVGFYSGAKKLLDCIAETEELADSQVELLCGISSVVYFASRLRMPWEDMELVSIHGREQNLVSAVRKNEKVFTLASDGKSIREIAKQFMYFGLNDVKMHVGADLSYPTEEILSGNVEEFLNYEKQGICVAVFENPRAREAVCVHGLPDEIFQRGKVPMTKEEVRSISLSKLRLTRNSVVYDVGAGTGSISVECALMADYGKVYAIETKEEGCRLIAENAKNLGASNLEIICGRAPEALEDLPIPTHAFIGGSGGNLIDILKLLFHKNPHIRIVVNCITLETVQETLMAARELGLDLEDIASVSVARSKSVGTYHMMMGQNPVYVMVLTKAECDVAE